MTAPDFVPLGVLEEHILVAVLRTRGEAYGMQVRREIERVTGRELAIGAVYATLDRLEEIGRSRSCQNSHSPSSRLPHIFARRGSGGSWREQPE